MGQSDNRRTVLSIKNRMRALGVNLDQCIGDITNVWDSTPIAPSFFVVNGEPYVAATHIDGSLIWPPSLYPEASTPVKGRRDHRALCYRIWIDERSSATRVGRSVGRPIASPRGY